MLLLRKLIKLQPQKTLYFSSKRLIFVRLTEKYESRKKIEIENNELNRKITRKNMKIHERVRLWIWDNKKKLIFFIVVCCVLNYMDFYTCNF